MGQLVFQANSGGQTNLVGQNTASTFNLNIPLANGTLVSTGDTGTVTNTMLAGSITNAKLVNSSVTIGSTNVALGATSTTLDGVNIGATTPGTGAFTTLSASSTTTLSGGTANGVAYLNGSKVLTTGSALTFDGTNLSSTGGATFQGSPSGYSGGEVRLGPTTADVQSSLSTQSTGSPILFFDHRGTSNTGVFAWRNSTGGGSELMRLTSTGLGIGTSLPNYSLTSYKGGAVANYLQVASGATGAGSGNGLLLGVDSSGNGIINAQGSVSLLTTVAGVLRTTIDTSGNLGLGVTPSAWSGAVAFDIGAGALSGTVNSGGLDLVNNAYLNGGAYKYKANGYATFLRQNSSGQFAWYTAASGTAGNAISFTQAMTLDNSGRLLVGLTSNSSSGPVQALINGTGTSFQTNPAVYSALSTVAGREIPMVYASDTTNSALISQLSGNMAFFTQASERARIDSSGNFLVGTTSTSGSASNSVNVVGGVFSTASGATSVPTATPTTFVTLPNIGTGVFIISISIAGAGSASTWVSTALVSTQSATSVVTSLHAGSGIVISSSGLSIQVTQTGGTTYSMNWTVIRLT